MKYSKIVLVGSDHSKSKQAISGSPCPMAQLKLPHAILKLVALLPSLKACQSAFDEKGLVQNAWGYFSTWRNVLTKHSHALAFRMRNSLSSESKAAHQNAFFFKKVNRDNLVLMLGLINIIFSFCACASNKKNPSRLRLKISVFLIVSFDEDIWYY